MNWVGNVRQRVVFTNNHPIFRKAAQAALFLVVTALVIDLSAFYLLGVRRLGSGSEAFYQESSLLGWEHKPHAEGAWYPFKDGTKTHVRINAYGFPDTERTITKSRKRIALIGDETVEFWEVEEDKRAQHVMESLLDGQVEVLNFGLRGAGTDQELIRYMNQVVSFSPDIVVLLFCVNDIDDNVTTESKPYFALDSGAAGGIRREGISVRSPQPTTGFSLRNVLEQSFVLRELKYLAVGTGVQFRVDVPLEDHFELRPFRRAYDGEDERRLELQKRLIEAFVNYSRERGMHFLLVEGLYRPALDEMLRQRVVDAYGDQFDFERITRVFTEHSATIGYAFLSLPRLVRERRMDVRKLMHPEDVMHLNADGARVLAAAVVETIRQNGWLEDAIPRSNGF